MRLNRGDTISMLQPHFLLFLLLLLLSASDAVFMDGTEHTFVQYPRWQVCMNSSIGLDFKTEDSDGLLFYTDDGGQNFFTLSLESRKLQLRFKLNSQNTEQFTANEKDLDDNQWHKVMIELTNKRAFLIVDNDSYNFAIGARVPGTDFPFVYLGGVNPGFQFVYLRGLNPGSIQRPHLATTPSLKFRGQMRNLQYSNCSCSLRSPAIIRISKPRWSNARRDNVCETNNPCDENNPNCDCLIKNSGLRQCNCINKPCQPEAFHVECEIGDGSTYFGFDSSFNYRTEIIVADVATCKQNCINEYPQCAGFTFKNTGHCSLKTKMVRGSEKLDEMTGICKEIQVVDVYINLARPVREVSERFVSVGFEASMIDSLVPLEIALRSEKLIALASALSPAFLRLGGTAADFVTFEQDACRGGGTADPNCVYCSGEIVFDLKPTLNGVSTSPSLWAISQKLGHFSNISYEYNPCGGRHNSRVLQHHEDTTVVTTIGANPQLVRVDTNGDGAVVVGSGGGSVSSADPKYALLMRGRDGSRTFIHLICRRLEQASFTFSKEQPPKTYHFLLMHVAACPSHEWEVTCSTQNNVEYRGANYGRAKLVANLAACKNECIKKYPQCRGYTLLDYIRSNTNAKHCQLKTYMDAGSRQANRPSSVSGICTAKMKGKSKGKTEPRTLNGRDWEEINEFALKTGLRLLFDVNGLKTNAFGDWDSSNAASLLRFSAAKRYSFDLQLGNEPNSYKQQGIREVSAEQLAKNYKELRRLLQSGIGGDFMKAAYLVGPEITQPETEQDEVYPFIFLKNAIGEINAISWHQYYLKGDTATFKNFTDPWVLNHFRDQIKRILSVRRDSEDPVNLRILKPIWLTETASASGGGTSGLSDRFVDGFPWLDKLGVAALGIEGQTGIDVVVRQTLFGGKNGLLDEDYFEPRPSYWVTLLFKRLVGRKVLKVLHYENEEFGVNEGRIRLYAHCAAAADNASPEKSKVTLFGLNVKEESIILRLKAEAAGGRMKAEAAEERQNMEAADRREKAGSAGGQMKSGAAGERMKAEAAEDRPPNVSTRKKRETSPWKVIVEKYVLQSDDNAHTSKTVRLNGETIYMNGVFRERLPVLRPVVEKFREADQVKLKLPGFGLAFYVIEGLDAAACQD